MVIQQFAPSLPIDSVSWRSTENQQSTIYMATDTTIKPNVLLLYYVVVPAVVAVVGGVLA